MVVRICSCSALDFLDEESSMQLLDEAEILQNQLEIALGADLWRRMRREAQLGTDVSYTRQSSFSGLLCVG